ncbi:hypothetical protein AVEN_111302-1 [Araneus ventricosus]|uniref:Uncharacterized protein n=1 Tax=Araneus ventricosus TaxID=182803 RepID=A0A4Y2GID7_ARAVE|nr:hypothetical protein AVEN_111302-1 [Araneus ventricosus]
MTRTTSELAPPLKTSTPHQREDVWPLRMICRATGPMHGGSSVGLGFEPGALRPQGRGLTTRLPWPPSLLDLESKHNNHYTGRGYTRWDRWFIKKLIHLIFVGMVSETVCAEMLSRTCRSNLVGEVVLKKLSYVNLAAMVSETICAEMLSRTAYGK